MSSSNAFTHWRGNSSDPRSLMKKNPRPPPLRRRRLRLLQTLRVLKRVVVVAALGKVVRMGVIEKGEGENKRRTNKHMLFFSQFRDFNGSVP